MDMDRVAGVLLGAACGDALGAGYEFGPPLPPEDESSPCAAATASLPASGPTTPPWPWRSRRPPLPGTTCARATGLDAVAGAFLGWFRGGPNDVGLQTRAVLRAADSAGGDSAPWPARRPSSWRPTRSGAPATGRSMRTAPVALAYLDDEAGLVEAAQAVSALTHADPVSQEACALWCLAIRHAVLEGRLDVRAGPGVPAGRPGGVLGGPARRGRGERAEGLRAQRLGGPGAAGGVVGDRHHAGAARRPGPGSFPAQHLRLALEAAVRGGRDADTVAAIAGALLGARWGASAVPAQWRRAIFGWPG